MNDIFKVRVSIQLRYSDFDMLKHLNNAAYATYLEIARLKYLTTIFDQYSIKWLDVVANLQINYRKPILPKDKPVVLIRCSRIGKSSYDLDYLIISEDDPNLIFADGKTIQVHIDPTGQTSTPIPDDIKKVLTSFEDPIK